MTIKEKIHRLLIAWHIVKYSRNGSYNWKNKPMIQNKQYTKSHGVCSIDNLLINHQNS